MAGKYSNTNNHFNPNAMDGPDGHDEEDDAYTKESSFLTERWSPGSVGTLHRYSDLDASQLAQHHTLGPRLSQASPGNHNHDGSTSKNIGAWTEYVNVANSGSLWLGSTTNPAIRNGTIEGRYCKIGTLCFVTWNTTFGSLTTFGSGSWIFKLPFPANLPVNNANGMCGSAEAYMNGIFKIGAVLFAGNNEVAIVTDGQASFWNTSTPQAWAASNAYNFSFSVFYETVS